MPNPYFAFKKFTVHHDRSTLKVCTDACLFGSWVPARSPQTILDIGTGSGLLALMMAQRFPEAQITAIEKDEPSYRQARQNFEVSLWSHRLEAVQGDILCWPKDNLNATDFDLVVCNPPFFKDHLQSRQNEAHNLACHQQELTLDRLAECCTNLVSDNGQIAIMLPNFEMTEMIGFLDDHDWHVHAEAVVHNQPAKPIFRRLCLFEKSAELTQPKSQTIYIKENGNNYSQAFTVLLKPFYLYL